MKKYETVVHISSHINLADDFHKLTIDGIHKLQSQGLEVEVQYAQSDTLFSALILGYINT